MRVHAEDEGLGAAAEERIAWGLRNFAGVQK